MKSRLRQIFRRLFFFVAPTFWFLIGFVFATLTLTSIVMIYFQVTYKDKAIPGLFVGNMYVGEKSKDEIKKIFDEKNQKISRNSIIFSYYDYAATISAKTLNIGYDSDLIATQALSVGKGTSIVGDFYMIIDAYLNGETIPLSYTFNSEVLENELEPIQKELYIEPVDAQFTVENNRVTAFTQSSNGRSVDFEAAEKTVVSHFSMLMNSKDPVTLPIKLPIKVLEPEITTEEANDFGIVEIIGEGNSSYVGSIPNRVYNVDLAASRVNGVLVAPGEEFSFNKTLGDVSTYTGYKQAYVISGGRTILGDGGGVCQVSTTLFRAILDAGLPITERNAHSYRVGYYEQNSPPGIDATIYVPTVDLKFKNDTGNHILIQSYVDSANRSLTYLIWGKKDGRVVEMTKPVITRQIAPAEPLYQDDPNLPKGQEKQIEHAAWGARVEFTRVVKKNGEEHLKDTFVTNYQPWRAVYLRGIQE